jgi:ribonuclease P protein component
MLARPYRLATARDISRVFKRGAYGSSALVLIKAAPNSRPLNRVAIVVSKKVSKKAVVRNRNRRRASGVVEQLWATLKTGYDIVITIRQDMSEVDTTEVERHIVQTLQKAGIIT